MITDKAITICLLEVLKEYSDEENVMTMKDILTKMNILYGLKPDRRTVYSAMSLLTDLGYDISLYEENKEGYYLRSRDIESSEVLLLCDAVYSFPFISARQSEQLIKKLQSQVSVHKRKRYRHLKLVNRERKTDNKQVFLNIEELDEAISLKKKVSFTYLKYDLGKNLIPRRERKYIVNPYQMVYMNEHYYLVCNYCGYNDTSFYKIDRMRDIEILEEDIDRPLESNKEIENAIYAFAGEPEEVIMHCSKYVIDDVIDKFGVSVRIENKDEETFEARVKVSPKGMKYWAMQYMQYVEVIQPQWLRDEIVEVIKENRYINNF